MSDKTLIHVEGMTCASCANTITRALQKEGLKEVSVNYITAEVAFEEVQPDILEKIKSLINSIGYRVAEEKKDSHQTHVAQESQHEHLHSNSISRKFFWSAIFTVPLLLHMILPFHWLHHPFVQLALCIPVMAIGFSFYGKSAWGSIKAHAMNMDVLIFIGSFSAFIYSLSGLWLYYGTPEAGNYLFFETAASIITFVLLGNLLEQRSVSRTTSAIYELGRLQPQIANKLIIAENGKETMVEIRSSEIKLGDILYIGTGDKIPVDGIVTSGSAMVDESMMTGESMPISKTEHDKITGGTIVEAGSLKVKAEAIGSETTLSKIIRMVSDAQLSKPEIQRLGDRISNIFVPAVLVISALTFLFTYFFLEAGITASVMRSIAVLVISCPCAMGLATPTALMVGIGRAARNGILIRGGITVEVFSKVKTIIFDKTGTLTTGNFTIRNIQSFGSAESEIKALLYALEQYSSHPIAKSIRKACEDFRVQAADLKWASVDEDKGRGINATDTDGNLFSLGSFIMAKHSTNDDSHSIYLLKNNKLIATVDLEDEIKSGARETISTLKKLGIRTIMMSGDRKAACEYVARELQMDEVYSQQLPGEKMLLVEKISKDNITAMVGDGINDAPALAKASVGVSLSDASQVAIQSAQIILLNSKDLTSLHLALSFSKHTLLTIKQNLFWAFAYNIIAIPVAAAGLLSPAIGALSMAFSDLILIGNSLRLRFRRID